MRNENESGYLYGLEFWFYLIIMFVVVGMICGLFEIISTIVRHWEEIKVRWCECLAGAVLGLLTFAGCYVLSWYLMKRSAPPNKPL